MELMPSVLDREIDTKDLDAFGHQDFAFALRSLIESPNNTPPYSIGLLGTWGTGKTTIKSLYLADLEDDRKSRVDGDIRRERIKTITFNAWRYGGDSDIKRALLKHVYLELDGNDQTLKDELYNQIKNDFLKARTLRDIWFEVCNLVPYLAFSVILVLAILATDCILKINNEWVKGAVATVISFTSALGVKFLGNNATFSIARYSKASRIEMPKTSSEEYESLLKSQINVFKHNNKKCQRLVIFVDDLDRLSAEEMVDGLDAIRTFMEIPNLPDNFGIVFVISCDEERIAQALGNRGRRNPEQPGAVFTQQDAHRYLDRIFQFRLEIPPLPKQDMRAYAKDILTKNASNVVAEIEANNGKLSDVIDRMIHVDVSGPRNVIQIVNAFVQSWWIAKKREFSGSGTNRAGGLLRGTITKHPTTLAIICALRVDFPVFYLKLQDEPELIQHFSDVFIDDVRIYDDLPPRPKLLLSDFQSNGSLLTHYDSLRRFLSGLRGNRWPESLQPFLQLNQDSTTRRYGGKSMPIFNALVSGDEKGLLQELAHEHDNKPISIEDAYLIASMVEELSGDSPVRKNNASAVIAAVSQRIPDDAKTRLLHPLCRQLELNRDFRSRISIYKIQSFLSDIHPDYQKTIVGLLINDALTDDGFLLKLPNMLTPSLDESIEMTKIIVSMSLQVWKTSGLSSKSQNVLKTWLLGREVKTSDKSYTIPFVTFEKWMNEYEDILLTSLRSNYTDILIGEFENDREKEVEIAVALKRADSVFNSLQSAGEEDREVLWRQISRLCGVVNEDGVLLACTYARKFKDDASSKIMSSLVSALAARLELCITDDDKSLAKRKEATQVLLEILTDRINDLDKSSLNAVQSTISNYLYEEDTVAEGLGLLNVFVGKHKKRVVDVATEMTTKLFDTLPDEGIKWLSTHYSLSLTDIHPQITNALSEAMVVVAVSEENARKYKVFMDEINEDDFESENMQSHLQSIFAGLAGRVNEFDEYIKPMFPIIASFYEYALPDNAGRALQKLFTGMNGKPVLLGWIHYTMMKYWPVSLAGYDANAIFTNAMNIAKGNPSQTNTEWILKSLSKLIKIGAVAAEGNSKQVVDLACGLWPYKMNDAAFIIVQYDEIPTPTQTSVFMNADSTDEDKYKCLEKVWRHIVTRQNESDRLATTGLILNNKLSGPQEMPDKALTIWFDCIGKEIAKKDLHEGILGDSMPDEHKCRLWGQAIDRRAEFGKEYYLEVIRAIFNLPNCSKTQKAILGAKQELNELYVTNEDSSILAKSIFTAFFAAVSLDIKRYLADWLSDIGGDSELKELHVDSYNGTYEDVKILHEKFPAYRRRLNKITEKFDSQDKQSSEE